MSGKILEMNMNMKTEGLLGNKGGGGVLTFFNILMSIMIQWGKQRGGMDMYEQRRMTNVRVAMEQALKVQDTKIEIEEDDFRFVDRCRIEAKTEPTANVAIGRLDKMITETAKENGIKLFEDMQKEPEHQHTEDCGHGKGPEKKDN